MASIRAGCARVAEANELSHRGELDECTSNYGGGDVLTT